MNLENSIQKPTLSEIAKVFKPSKKDIIELTRGVIEEERGQAFGQLCDRREQLRKAIRDLNKQVTTAAEAQCAKLIAKVRKILPDATITINHMGDGACNVHIGSTAKIQTEVPKHLAVAIKQAQEDEQKVGDAIQKHHQDNRRNYVSDEDVTRILLRRRFEESGDLRPLLLEIQDAVKKDLQQPPVALIAQEVVAIAE